MKSTSLVSVKTALHFCDIFGKEMGCKYKQITSLLTEKQAPQREEAHRVFIRATDSTQDLRTGMQGQIPGRAKRLKEGQANYETKTCAVYPLNHRIHLCWGLLALLRVG